VDSIVGSIGLHVNAKPNLSLSIEVDFIQKGDPRSVQWWGAHSSTAMFSVGSQVLRRFIDCRCERRRSTEDHGKDRLFTLDNPCPDQRYGTHYKRFQQK
jgi:hypothetical protein